MDIRLIPFRLICRVYVLGALEQSAPLPNQRSALVRGQVAPKASANVW